MKSILVHADGTAATAGRLRFAAELATRHGAHLTALFAVTPPALDPSAAYAASSVAVKLLLEAHERSKSSARAALAAARATTSVQAGWAEVDEGAAPLPTFMRQAHCADLVVLGQQDPALIGASQVPSDFVSAVILGSGRPAIVLPYTGEGAATIGTVLVAWKPSAQAARAVAAALPVLKGARHVHLVSWGRDDAAGCHGKALDIEGYLRRHGVSATPHHESAAGDEIGELMLSKAADVGADLLVMGCYAHSRVRELVLGGATRVVLESMTVPVLMSH
jgi:nucleotide-binding universal stress UspA family protein